MKKVCRIIATLAAVCLMVPLLCSCGGKTLLDVKSHPEKIFLENEKIRIAFNKSTGAVTDLVNLEKGLTLTENVMDAIPLLVEKISKEQPQYTAFTYETPFSLFGPRSLRFTWDFEDGLQVISDIKLESDADEVVFNLSVKNNHQDDSVLSIQYPVFSGVNTLGDKEDDYYVTPFCTGYLFNNPVDNFNTGMENGIYKDLGLYPSGFGLPMQYHAYYQKDEGGFLFMTRDGADGVKSFTCTGEKGNLKIGMYHYMDDIGDGDHKFDYDISVSNLVKGSWEEASDKYRNWAVKQKWCTEKGTLDQRTDVDPVFHEQTTLVNFSFPYASRIGWEEEQALYQKLSESAKGKMFNISLDTLDPIRKMAQDNGDRLVYFELYTFVDPADKYLRLEFKDDLILDQKGDIAFFTISDNTENSGRIYYYGCPAQENWLDFCIQKEQGYYDSYQISGYYHDINLPSCIERQCFDTSHAHGTRINIVSDFVEMERRAKNLAVDLGIYNNGGELIIEQLLPYLDYYQCRANGGLLSWQEHDRIRSYLEKGTAKKIPLFEYVYHDYGAVRMDGYMNADTRIRDPYYYVCAFTALNGGIPEYNYEFVGLDGSACLTADQLDEDMLIFLGKLGEARTGYGKDWLVYGTMRPAPDLSAAGQSKSAFFNPNRNEGAGQTGMAVFDSVVASAYTYKDKTAIFLCNVTGEPMDVEFTIDALEDYGVSKGEVKQYSPENEQTVAQIEDGVASVSMTLPAREIIMLIID